MNDISHEKLLENLFDGVYYVDLDKTIVYWNRAAERITGFTRPEVIGKCCSDNILRHIDDDGRELCIEGCPLGRSLVDGQVHEANVYLHHKEGHRVPVSIRVSPIREPDGHISGAVEIFSDNSNLYELLHDMERLRNEAYVDTLTGIGNRRYGEMSLHAKMHDYDNFNVSFAVLFIDIDHFKNINDTFGHEAGDSALAMTSKTIANLLRRMDSVIRWGGEEFLVIVPNIDANAMNEIAERIRIFVERSFIMIGDTTLSATVSIGATMARPDDTVESIIRRADELMYASKRSGRNRVTAG